ncbi:MAG: hypothetical protein H0X41_08515, partial [Chitinophagaceae bacterium]|nr:hypothetical protein [Chitinophagaceae bacterium]
MNKITRRDLMKSGLVLSGGMMLSFLDNGKLLANDEFFKEASNAADIREVHLVNLSHHDYGYTDLPSSVWDYQVNNIRLAMKYINQTKNYPADAQFKWTIEGLWGLERFWKEATDIEKEMFESMVSSGHIEVTAMPGNMTCLVDSCEWEKELDRLKFFYDKFKPAVALQDDVNGLPWGMIESLLKRDVAYVTMAANGYKGGKPLPPPSFFWWEGISGKKILMYNGDGYANGYDYFHTTEWRKGPVPNRYDIWFNAPSGNEIFSSKKEDILAAHDILTKKLEGLKAKGYSLPVVQLTFTNMWTIDNDQPCRQVSEFIKTWNELNLQPKLTFSTPAQFIGKAKKEFSGNIPTLKGEWCDWWADGIAASPFEVSLLQEAKRRNKDIKNAIRYFTPAAPFLASHLSDLDHQLVFASEHTWGAYDSVAHPYNARTGGNHAQKFDYFFQADENSKRIQAEIIRLSDRY